MLNIFRELYSAQQKCSIVIHELTFADTLLLDESCKSFSWFSKHPAESSISRKRASSLESLTSFVVVCSPTIVQTHSQLPHPLTDSDSISSHTQSVCPPSTSTSHATTFPAATQSRLNENNEIEIEHFSVAEISSYLTSNAFDSALPRDSICIQKYLESPQNMHSKDPRGHCVTLDMNYASNMSRIVSKRNTYYIQDTCNTRDLYNCLLSFEAPDTFLDVQKLSDYHENHLIYLSRQIVIALDALHSHLRGKVQQISLVFKQIKDTFYLLHCNRIVFANETLIPAHLRCSFDFTFIVPIHTYTPINDNTHSNSTCVTARKLYNLITPRDSLSHQHYQDDRSSITTANKDKTSNYYELNDFTECKQLLRRLSSQKNRALRSRSSNVSLLQPTPTPTNEMPSFHINRNINNLFKEIKSNQNSHRSVSSCASAAPSFRKLQEDENETKQHLKQQLQQLPLHYKNNPSEESYYFPREAGEDEALRLDSFQLSRRHLHTPSTHVSQTKALRKPRSSLHLDNIDDVQHDQASGISSVRSSSASHSLFSCSSITSARAMNKSSQISKRKLETPSATGTNTTTSAVAGGAAVKEQVAFIKRFYQQQHIENKSKERTKSSELQRSTQQQQPSPFDRKDQIRLNHLKNNQCLRSEDILAQMHALNKSRKPNSPNDLLNINSESDDTHDNIIATYNKVYFDQKHQVQLLKQKNPLLHPTNTDSPQALTPNPISSSSSTSHRVSSLSSSSSRSNTAARAPKKLIIDLNLALAPSTADNTKSTRNSGTSASCSSTTDLPTRSMVENHNPNVQQQQYSQFQQITPVTRRLSLPKPIKNHMNNNNNPMLPPKPALGIATVNQNSCVSRSNRNNNSSSSINTKKTTTNCTSNYVSLGRLKQDSRPKLL